MTSSTPRRLACALAAVVCWMFVAGPLLPAPAQADQTSRGQLAYACDIVVEENPQDPVTYNFTFGLQLSVPDQVSPGDRLALRGTFSVVVPENMRSTLAAYFSSVQIVSDSLTMPVTVNGRTTVLRTSRFDSGRVSTATSPLVLSGTISAAPFTVPANASGPVTVSLPSNNTVRSEIDRTPAAFNAVGYFQGGIVPGYDHGTDRFACRHRAGANRTVASIPVARATQSPATPDTSTDPGTDPGTAPGTDPGTIPGTDPGDLPTTSVSGPGSTPGPGRSGRQPRATQRAAPTGAADVAAADTTPVAAVPGTGEDGARIHPWVLVLLLLALGAMAVLLNAASVHRARMHRTEQDGASP